MSLPEVVRDRLGGEEPFAMVPLGGDDELVVTPTRTLIYRAEGLLSSESVEEYTHDAERVALTEGRRKSTVHLDYGVEGEREFTIPRKQVDEALAPVLSGVLVAAGITEPDEAISELYRLGELTVAVTDARVIKHVGDAVWDEEFEEYEFERVTGLEIEAGDVSSEIVIEVDRRPQRIKTASDDARLIRDRIETALLAYHDVASYPEFQRLVAPPEDEDDEEDDAEVEAEVEAPAVEEAASSDDAEEPGTIGVDSVAAEVSGQPVDVAREVAALRKVVERQNELLESNRRTVEQLIEELRQGR